MHIVGYRSKRDIAFYPDIVALYLISDFYLSELYTEYIVYPQILQVLYFYK